MAPGFAGGFLILYKVHCIYSLANNLKYEGFHGCASSQTCQGSSPCLALADTLVIHPQVGCVPFYTTDLEPLTQYKAVPMCY